MAIVSVSLKHLIVTVMAIQLLPFHSGILGCVSGPRNFKADIFFYLKVIDRDTVEDSMTFQVGAVNFVNLNNQKEPLPTRPFKAVIGQQTGPGSHSAIIE